ncbi:hypothetical protein [Cryobacterium sp. MDB2-33-2]|nr:hypothetical protein [Cryobacterium sp. MDB2-33-2]
MSVNDHELVIVPVDAEVGFGDGATGVFHAEERRDALSVVGGGVATDKG